VRTGARALRMIAGALVLVVLATTAFVLVPSYIANWKLRNYIADLANGISQTHSSEDTIRARIVNEAASLGIPVHSDDVHVRSSPGGAVHIEVLYIVHIDVGGYTVDLHFRPTATGS